MTSLVRRHFCHKHGTRSSLGRLYVFLHVPKFYLLATEIPKINDFAAFRVLTRKDLGGVCVWMCAFRSHRQRCSQ